MFITPRALCCFAGVRASSRHVTPGALAVLFVFGAFLPGCLRADAPPTWTLRNSGTRQSLNGVTGNGTLFVAVGDGGMILTSPDAIRWSPQVSFTKSNLNRVAWFRGLFVAVGDNGLILISHDGVGWSAQNSRTTFNLHGVAAGANTVAAVGDHGTIVLSSDGSNWSAPATPDFLPTKANPAASSNGSNNRKPAPTAASSRRGNSATPQNRSNPGPLTPQKPPDLHYIAASPRGFIAVADHLIATSADGIVWATVGAGQANRSGSATSASARGVGRATPLAANNNPATTAARRAGVAARGSVGVRGRAARGGPAVRGVNTSVMSDALSSVAQNDNIAVAVDGLGGIWASINGANWAFLKNSVSGEFTQKLADVYWSGAHFVAVGGKGAILTSLDGEHWQWVDSPTPENLAAVSSRPGLLVAVGANGTILTSGDLPVIAQPAITPAGGVFKALPMVTLSCKTSGAVLHYTLDGTEPNESSTPYDQPFRLPKPGTLRVRAFKDGMDSGLEASTAFQLPVAPKIIESTNRLRMPFPPAMDQPLANFIVKTSGGIPAPVFHWQRKPAGKEEWLDYVDFTDKGQGSSEAPVYLLEKLDGIWLWDSLASNGAVTDVQTSVLEVHYDFSMNGDLFRCIISNEAGAVVSPEAILAIFIPVPAVVVKQPESSSVLVGQTASFTTNITGDPEPTYQWVLYPHQPIPWGEAAIAEGVELQDSAIYAGTHSSKLLVKSTTLLMSGDEFVCAYTNGYPPKSPPFPPFWTDRVTLQVFRPTPLILKQPSSVVTLPGTIVTFGVEVNTDLLTNIQWQCLTPGSLTWQPLKESLLYTGVNDRTLTLNQTSLNMSGYKYRCEVDNGPDEPPQFSSVAVLTVKR